MSAGSQAIDQLAATMPEPVELPTPDVVMRQAATLRELVDVDPEGRRAAKGR